jgi:hypothetical protein
MLIEIEDDFVDECLIYLNSSIEMLKKKYDTWDAICEVTTINAIIKAIIGGNHG